MNLFLEKIQQTIDTELLLSKLDLSPDDVVCLSGSLFEALHGKFSKDIGNRLSDIDVFILSETSFQAKHDMSYTYDHACVYYKRIDNIPYDITLVSYDQLLKMFDQISHMCIDQRKLPGNQIDFPHGWNFKKLNEMIHRLRYSLPIQNLDKFHNLMNSLNISLFCKFYSKKILTRVDGLLPDILGNFENGQYDACLHCLREAYILFMQSVIYYENDTIDRDKWTALKLKNINRLTGRHQQVVECYTRLFLNEVKLSSTIITEYFNLFNNYFGDLEGDLFYEL